MMPTIWHLVNSHPEANPENFSSLFFFLQRKFNASPYLIFQGINPQTKYEFYKCWVRRGKSKMFKYVEDNTGSYLYDSNVFEELAKICNKILTREEVMENDINSFLCMGVKFYGYQCDDKINRYTKKSSIRLLIQVYNELADNESFRKFNELIQKRPIDLCSSLLLKTRLLNNALFERNFDFCDILKSQIEKTINDLRTQGFENEISAAFPREAIANALIKIANYRLTIGQKIKFFEGYFEAFQIYPEDTFRDVYTLLYNIRGLEDKLWLKKFINIWVKDKEDQETLLKWLIQGYELHISNSMEFLEKYILDKAKLEPIILKIDDKTDKFKFSVAIESTFLFNKVLFYIRHHHVNEALDILKDVENYDHIHDACKEEFKILIFKYLPLDSNLTSIIENMEPASTSVQKNLFLVEICLKLYNVKSSGALKYLDKAFEFLESANELVAKRFEKGRLPGKFAMSINELMIINAVEHDREYEKFVDFIKLFNRDSRYIDKLEKLITRIKELKLIGINFDTVNEKLGHLNFEDNPPGIEKKEEIQDVISLTEELQPTTKVDDTKELQSKVEDSYRKIKQRVQKWHTIYLNDNQAIIWHYKGKFFNAEQDDISLYMSDTKPKIFATFGPDLKLEEVTEKRFKKAIEIGKARALEGYNGIKEIRRNFEGVKYIILYAKNIKQDARLGVGEWVVDATKQNVLVFFNYWIKNHAKLEEVLQDRDFITKQFSFEILGSKLLESKVVELGDVGEPEVI